MWYSVIIQLLIIWFYAIEILHACMWVGNLQGGQKHQLLTSEYEGY